MGSLEVCFKEGRRSSPIFRFPYDLTSRNAFASCRVDRDGAIPQCHSWEKLFP